MKSASKKQRTAARPPKKPRTTARPLSPPHALRSVLFQGRGKWVLPALSVAFFIVVLIRTAWLSDDAFITFRTVDNFIAGYGLRWNVAERVQTYTHPLWMLLVAGAYAITREMYLTVL